MQPPTRKSSFVPVSLAGNSNLQSILSQNLDSILTRHDIAVVAAKKLSGTSLGSGHELFTKFYSTSDTMKEWQKKKKVYTESKSSKAYSEKAKKVLNKHEKSLSELSSLTRLSGKKYREKYIQKSNSSGIFASSNNRTKKRRRPQSANSSNYGGPVFGFDNVAHRRTKPAEAKALELQVAERTLQRVFAMKASALGIKHKNLASSIESLLSCYHMQRKHDLFKELKHFPRRHLSRLRNMTAVDTVRNSKSKISCLPRLSKSLKSEESSKTSISQATKSPLVKSPATSPSPVKSPSLETTPSVESENVKGNTSPAIVPANNLTIATAVSSGTNIRTKAHSVPKSMLHRGKQPKVRCCQKIRLSLRQDKNMDALLSTLSLRIGIENNISPVVLSWNASATDVENIILSLGHPNIGNVRAIKGTQIRNVGLGNAPDLAFKNTGGFLEYSSNKWNFDSDENPKTQIGAEEQYRPRYECRKIIEWNVEIACYEPTLPLLCAEICSNKNTKGGEHIDDAAINDLYNLTVAWTGRPMSPIKHKSRKKTRLTQYLERQNFTGAANLVREEAEKIGTLSESASRIFRASIAKIREYPKQEEFRAEVCLEIKSSQATRNGNEICKTKTFYIGENIEVHYSYIPHSADVIRDHNDMDWIGLFEVNNLEEVNVENKRQEMKGMQIKRKFAAEISVKNDINDIFQRKHLSPVRRKTKNSAFSSSTELSDSALFVPSRMMNKSTLISRTIVPKGINSGALHISQDPEVCRSIIPGNTYVLCYCLHGSLCSVGNLIAIQARSVPVDFVVNPRRSISMNNKINYISGSINKDLQVYCGDGLRVEYRYNYKHNFTKPSGDWIGLYCLHGGEANTPPLSRDIDTKKFVNVQPVVKYNLSSSRTGTIIVEDQPRYPGMYKLILWQNTTSGNIILAVSNIINVKLFDFHAKDGAKDKNVQREMRIFLSSSLLGCSMDILKFKKQVLPLAMRFADSRKVALSILDLHEEIQTTDFNGLDGGAEFIAESLKLQNACRPYGIYILSSKYGQVFQKFSEKLCRHAPWLTGITNKILGSRGASLVDIEIKSGLLVPQCIRPELRTASITCIQDISYDSTIDMSVKKQEPIEHIGDEDNQQMLNDAVLNLKDRASNSTNNMITNYCSSDSLCASLQGHLLKLISKEYPEATVPTYDTIIGIAMDAVIERLGTKTFSVDGNEIYQSLSTAFQDYITKQVEGEAIVPLSVVSEHPGCGKTSSVAHWVYSLKSNSSDSPFSSSKEVTIDGIQCFVLVTFVGTSPACSTAVGVMWRVCAELKHRFKIDDAMPETMKDIEIAFQTWPARCFQTSGRRIVLIFDDLENLRETSKPYSRVKKDETLVGSKFVESIRLPLHPGVRLIATMITHSKCFDACTGMTSDDSKWCWQQLRLPKLHVFDLEDRMISIAQLHNSYDGANNSRTLEFLHSIENRSTNSNPITMHGFVSSIYFFNIKLSAIDKNKTSSLSFIPEGLTTDELTTWELFQLVNDKYPRFELLMCLLLVANRGLLEHEIIECFKVVTERADVELVGQDWLQAKPLKAWLDLRDFIQPRFASVICGRWIIPSDHIRRVVSYILPVKGFQFYASLLLHVVSINTAIYRKAEEKPYLLWSMLQYNIDEGKFARSQNQQHCRSSKKSLKKQQQLLLKTVVSPLILCQLVSRVNHPQLGMYLRAVKIPFMNIAFEACHAMNNALNTHPIIKVEEKPIPATSQQRRKKKKDHKPSLWEKHFDVHQLLSRRLKVLLGGREGKSKQNSNTKDVNISHNITGDYDDNNESEALPHRQVFAVGKLLQLFNFHEPSASLLRTALLMNMKKTTFKRNAAVFASASVSKVKMQPVAIDFEEPKMSALEFKEWVRSRSLAWKKARLNLKPNELEQLATATKNDVRDMREALGLLMESFSFVSSNMSGKDECKSVKVLLKEGKRMLDRFVVELDVGSGNTLERRSEILLRENFVGKDMTNTAKEWPQLQLNQRSKKRGSDEGNIFEEEEFSSFMLC
jgi:hypothetical protein